jgi:PAS domain S-box-containing protein
MAVWERPIEEPGFRDDGALYRSLVEQLPAVVYIDSNEAPPRSLYVSPQCVEMFGRRPTEFLADRELWGRCIHPDDRARVFDVWEEAVGTQQRFEAEYRWVRPDGRLLWVHDTSVLVRSAGGQPLFWQGLLDDITAIKETERALRDSDARYRFLVENIPAAVYMVAPDDDRRTLYVSPQIARALGYEQDEWLDQPDIWMELLHPDDRESTLARHDEHNESGEPWNEEYRLIASDGRAIWFHDVANLVRDERGTPLYWLGVQMDVTQLRLTQDQLRAARDSLERRVLERTSDLEEANELMALEIEERRRAEAELRLAERRYRTLAENIPAVTYIWEVDPPSDRDPQFYTSPRIEQLLGYSVEEWHAGHDFSMSRVHPDDRAAVGTASLRSETTGEPFWMEYRYLHKDGHIVWVLDQAVLVSRRPNGRPALFQGLMMDITARKEAEAKAHESEVRYRALALQVPAITWVFDPVRGRTTYVSPQLTSILGYTLEDWATIDRWLETVHPDDRDRMRAFAATAVGAGEPFEIEYRIVRRDGIVRWMRAQGAVVSRDASGRANEYQGVVIDMTSTRHAQDKKMEALALYRAVVEQIPAATYIELAGSTPDHVQLAYLSPQIEAIFGRSAEDLLADPGHFARILHPDDRDRVLAADDHSGETGEPFDQEFRVIRPDGSIAWVHSLAALVRDEDGTPLFWHGVAIDITAQRTHGTQDWAEGPMLALTDEGASSADR